MSFLYEYMNEEELRDAKINAIMDNMYEHVKHQFALVEMNHEARLNDIETAMLIKEGTDDDLAEQYEKEAEIYQEGLKEAWEAFKEFLRKLFNIKPKELQKPKDPSVRFKLPYDINGMADATEKIANSTTGLVEKIKENPGITVASVTGLAIFGAAIKVGLSELKAKFKKETEMTADESYKAWSRIFNIGEKLKNLVKKETDNASASESEGESEEKKGIRKTIQDMLSGFADIAAHAADFVESLIPFGRKNASRDPQKEGEGPAGADGSEGKDQAENKEEAERKKAHAERANATIAIVKKINEFANKEGVDKASEKLGITIVSPSAKNKQPYQLGDLKKAVNGLFNNKIIDENLKNEWLKVVDELITKHQPPKPQTDDKTDNKVTEESTLDDVFGEGFFESIFEDNMGVGSLFEELAFGEENDESFRDFLESADDMEDLKAIVEAW